VAEREGMVRKKEGRSRCFSEQWLSVLYPYVFPVEYGLFPHEYGPFPCEYYVFLHEPKKWRCFSEQWLSAYIHMTLEYVLFPVECGFFHSNMAFSHIAHRTNRWEVFVRAVALWPYILMKRSHI